MLYTLLPNPLYSFDIKGNLYFKNILTKTQNTIIIKLYDTPVKKPLDWFFKLAKYSIWLPPECQHRIVDVEFIKFGKTFSKNLEYYIGTKEPIIYNNKYAIPLSCPNIAISKDCEIISTIDGSLFNSKYNKYSSIDYHTLYLFNRKYLTHRLILDAWVYNTNPDKLIMCNHKDGVKSNNKLDNLEWVSHSDNINHAIEIGLRTDNVRVKIKHYTNDNIIEFSSISNAVRFIKGYYLTVNEVKKITDGKTINGYEIKLLEDNSDWFYNNKNRELVPNKARFKYVLTKDSEVLLTCYDLNKINKFFGFGVKWYIDKWKTYCLENNMSLDVYNLTNNEGYELYNIVTDEVIHSTDINNICKILDTNKVSFYNRMRYNKPRLLNNYIVCIGKNNDFQSIKKNIL